MWDQCPGDARKSTFYLFLWLLVSLLLYEERIQSLNPYSLSTSVMPWRSPVRHAQGTQKCPWSQNLYKARTIRWRKISMKKICSLWFPLDHWLTEGISCKIAEHQHANNLQKYWREGGCSWPHCLYHNDFL